MSTFSIVMLWGSIFFHSQDTVLMLPRGTTIKSNPSLWGHLLEAQKPETFHSEQMCGKPQIYEIHF